MSESKLQFSIALLMERTEHLLPLTLDTLSRQEEKNFEVQILTNHHFSGESELKKNYPDLNLEVTYREKYNHPQMMNEALAQSRGKYIQFIYPGDRLLSQQTLGSIKKLIDDHAEPHIVYSSFLDREEDRPPEAKLFPLNQELLRRGLFPTSSRCSWFLKEALLQQGGFNEKCVYRPTFDKLCDLYLNPKTRVASSSRVFVDSDLRKKTANEVIGYAMETSRILYRHFGTLSAMRWAFIQDHPRMLRWTLRKIKQSFTNR